MHDIWSDVCVSYEVMCACYMKLCVHVIWRDVWVLYEGGDNVGLSEP